MQFAEFFIRSEQVSGVGLVLSKYLKNVRVVLFQVISLLIAVHADIANRSVLFDANL